MAWKFTFSISSELHCGFVIGVVKSQKRTGFPGLAPGNAFILQTRFKRVWKSGTCSKRVYLQNALKTRLNPNNAF